MTQQHPLGQYPDCWQVSPSPGEGTPGGRPRPPRGQQPFHRLLLAGTGPGVAGSLVQCWWDPCICMYLAVFPTGKQVSLRTGLSEGGSSIGFVFSEAKGGSGALGSDTDSPLRSWGGGALPELEDRRQGEAGTRGWGRGKSLEAPGDHKGHADQQSRGKQQVK